jgi:hypothetical protein
MLWWIYDDKKDIWRRVLIIACGFAFTSVLANV